MLDRNFVIALTASMILIIGYNYYYQIKFGDYIKTQDEIALEKEKAEKEIARLGETGQDPNVAKPNDITPAAPEPSVAPAAPVGIGPGVAAVTVDSQEAYEQETSFKRVVVSTGLLRVSLSNRGGIPVSMELENYFDDKGKNINLWFDHFKLSREQDALQREATEKNDNSFKRMDVYPTLGLKFPKRAFSGIINSAYFTSDTQPGDIALAEGDEPLTIKYRYKDSSGVEVLKEYTFYPNSYEFDFSVTVKSTEKWGDFRYDLVWFGLEDEVSELGSFYSYDGPLVFANDLRLAEQPEEDDPYKEFSGNIKWSALAHRYYTVIGIPEVQKNREVVSRYISDTTSTLEWKWQAKVDDSPMRLRFYVGPKLHKQLERYKHDVVSIIDYGWFDVLAKPMYWLLATFFDWTGNWGWSIIMLTIVAKVLFFPLTQKGFKSMQKLQKIQPHLKRIQEAYKDDKEKLNQAMMELYKEHKVNPFGSCMPIMLQMPIFFALYKVLLESIELKGAPWILWVTDLSLRDPYYVTPVLMGGSMLLQQMMTPHTGDPMQRKMMMLLPVVFTFMFLTFPSGLVIYWLVNNLLTIVQQYIIYKDKDK